MGTPGDIRGGRGAEVNRLSQTRVVNVRQERCDVYIGRGSPFGNPYPTWEEDDPADALRKFEYDFLARISGDLVFRRLVLALKGKALGCH